MRQLVVVALVACSSDPSMMSVDDPVTIAFTAPAAGANLPRDHVSAATGALVATLPVELAIEGSPARVALFVDGLAQPDLAVAEIATDAATLNAVAYDADDAELASATVEVGSTDATPSDCHAALDMYGVEYTLGPANMGVADPITAKVPLNGLAWRYIDSDTQRTKQYADCKLILSLAKATPFFRTRGITEVADYGIYNYRCIGGGDPPCTMGISQHASATAIDLAAFATATDTYTVKTDWVIDPDDEETCEAATEPGKDQFLHELICALKAAHVWNIVLTPNYNADHRDHFHVDLTPGANFME